MAPMECGESCARDKRRERAMSYCVDDDDLARGRPWPAGIDRVPEDSRPTYSPPTVLHAEMCVMLYVVTQCAKITAGHSIKQRSILPVQDKDLCRTSVLCSTCVNLIFQSYTYVRKR